MAKKPAQIKKAPKPGVPMKSSPSRGMGSSSSLPPGATLSMVAKARAEAAARSKKTAQIKKAPAGRKPAHPVS